MAITLITVPNVVVAAYNPIIITCSSDNTAQPNFKYIYEIYIDAVLVGTIKQSPRPNGYGLIDVHRIAENYLSYDFNVGEATDAYGCGNSWNEIEVKIGEEYGTTPTEHLNLESCSTTIINSALKHSIASFYGSQPNFIDTDFRSDYMMSNAVTGTSRPFLTSSPRTLKICANKNYYLYALINIGNEPVRLRVAVYDSSGTQITAASKSLTTTSDYIVRYAVGPENIELWSAGLLNGASYYTVQLQNGASAGISEIFTFQVDCECSKYTENFRLHFLNHLGGFDAKSFNFKFERKFKLNKSFYTKILGSQDDSTGVFTYAVSDAGEVNFDTITTETITINTNNITEEESKWLLTLLKSTQVYWEIDVDVYAPVVVTDVSYEQQLYASKKLFNVSVTIRISNEIISQRQ